MVWSGYMRPHPQLCISSVVDRKLRHTQLVIVHRGYAASRAWRCLLLLLLLVGGRVAALYDSLLVVRIARSLHFCLVISSSIDTAGPVSYTHLTLPTILLV